MKNLISIIALFLSSVLFGQSTLDSVISTNVCACISQTNTLSEESFSDCFQFAFQQKNNLIIQNCLSLYGDTSEQTAHKFGQAIYDRISVSMIYSCTPYYKTMDSIRYSSFEGLNKDSLKTVILSFNKTDSKTWDKDFFTQRGVMYFQIFDLDNALKDFNAALNLDPNALQCIYFKAWTLELKKIMIQHFYFILNWQH